jgi:hypothetical protein
LIATRQQQCLSVNSLAAAADDIDESKQGPLILLDNLNPRTLWLAEDTGEGRVNGAGDTQAFLAKNMTALEAGAVIDELLRRYPSYDVVSEPHVNASLVLFVLQERNNAVTKLWRRLRDLHAPRAVRECNASAIIKNRGWNNGFGSDKSQNLGMAVNALNMGSTACVYNWNMTERYGFGNYWFEPGPYWNYAYDTCDLQSPGTAFCSQL